MSLLAIISHKRDQGTSSFFHRGGTVFCGTWILRAAVSLICHLSTMIFLNATWSALVGPHWMQLYRQYSIVFFFSLVLIYGFIKIIKLELLKCYVMISMIYRIQYCGLSKKLVIDSTMHNSWIISLRLQRLWLNHSFPWKFHDVCVNMLWCLHYVHSKCRKPN